MAPTHHPMMPASITVTTVIITMMVSTITIIIAPRMLPLAVIRTITTMTPQVPAAAVAALTVGAVIMGITNSP